MLFSILAETDLIAMKSQSFFIERAAKSWYNTSMQLIFETLSLISHMAFISLFWRLLTNLVDWSKWLKIRPETQGQARLLVLLLSLVLGYISSRFLLEVISLSQRFWTFFSL